MDEAPFTNRAQTLDGARAFRERGGRLVRLAFPETQAQRFGDVVVLYGRYEVVIQSDGAERTMRGRLTEMFVRRGGKWLHPGWHLDLTARSGACGAMTSRRVFCRNGRGSSKARSPVTLLPLAHRMGPWSSRSATTTPDD